MVHWAQASLVCAVHYFTHNHVNNALFSRQVAAMSAAQPLPPPLFRLATCQNARRCHFIYIAGTVFYFSLQPVTKHSSSFRTTQQEHVMLQCIASPPQQNPHAAPTSWEMSTFRYLPTLWL